MGMMQDFQKADEERHLEVKQLQGEVATMLKDLAKGDTDRRSEIATMRSDVADMLKDLAKEDARRASEVTSNMRSAVATIHEQVWGKAPAKKAGAPPKVAPTPKVAPPVGALRDRVFAYLADHPDGTKLVELEVEFGVSRIEMARVLRNLMDNNKVEKRELLYFAI